MKTTHTIGSQASLSLEYTAHGSQETLIREVLESISQTKDISLAIDTQMDTLHKVQEHTETLTAKLAKSIDTELKASPIAQFASRIGVGVEVPSQDTDPLLIWKVYIYIIANGTADSPTTQELKLELPHPHRHTQVEVSISAPNVATIPLQLVSETVIATLTDIGLW